LTISPSGKFPKLGKFGIGIQFWFLCRFHGASGLPREKTNATLEQNERASFKLVVARIFLCLLYFFQNTFPVENAQFFQFPFPEGCDVPDPFVRVFNIPEFNKRAIVNGFPKLATFKRDYQIGVVDNFFVEQHSGIFLILSVPVRIIYKKSVELQHYLN